MGDLKKFWDSKHVDTYNKYLIYQSIPMNLLLCGCEVWALFTTLNNKLEVFLLRHSRRILRISMFQVKYDHIRLEDIQERFYNIPSVENMIDARQLLFIGKAVQYP